MNRAITGFHQDTDGDWVAELACGHNQHVRHRPPFQQRSWVLSPGGRDQRLGTPLSCPLCDRAELPEAIRPVRSSPVWDEHTMPPGLRRAHRLGAGTWGMIRVHLGVLRFSMRSEPTISTELRPASPVQAIPPEMDHDVQPLERVRFSIDFFEVDRGGRGAVGIERPDEQRAATDEQGGDPACWAALLCPECGVVLTGGPHREGCSLGNRWPS
jgi:tellurite resistance-related uncharacterized protein